MSLRSLLRREPLGAALLLLNVALGVTVVRHFFYPPPARPARAGLPPGHPDVSVPALRGPDRPVFDIVGGFVTLDPKLAQAWPKNASVFVIARDEKGGPPYAVRRYDGVKPPFKFELAQDNVMLQSGGSPPQRLILSARVDQDGDAMTRQLGDLESAPSGPYERGSVLMLNIDRPATLVP